MSEIEYTIVGSLTYAKSADAKKARQALAKVALSAPGLDAVTWDGDSGLSIDFSAPVTNGSAWGTAIQGLHALSEPATGGGITVTLLDERRVIHPGGAIDILVPELPQNAIARLGSLSLRHPTSISAVAVSPDGRLLATASRSLERRGGGLELAACSHYGSDYWRKVWGNGDIRVWDVGTGALRWRLLDRSNGTSKLVFRHDGGALLALGERVSGYPKAPGRSWTVGAHHFDLATGTEQTLVTSRAVDVAFSQDGRLIITCTEREAAVWDAASLKKRLKVGCTDAAFVGLALTADRLILAEAGGALRSVALSDGSEEPPVDLGFTVRAWRTAPGAAVVWVRRDQGPWSEVTLATRTLSDGLISARTVHVGPGGVVGFNGSSGFSISPPGAPWDWGPMQSDAVCLLPDGTLALSGWSDTVLRFVDPLTGTPRPAPGGLVTATGHTQQLHGTGFSHDGRAVTTSYDRRVCTWSAEGTPERIDADWSICGEVRGSADGRWMAIQQNDRVHLLDKRTDTTRTHEIIHHDHLAFTPDQRRMIFLGYKKILSLELESGEQHRLEWDLGARALLILSDTRALVSDYEAILEIDLETFAILRRCETGRNENLRLLPDGRVQAVNDKGLLWLDPDRFVVLDTLDRALGPFGVRDVSPDGRWAAEQNGSIVQVRELASGAVAWSAIGHLAAPWMHTFRFSPDSSRLITGGGEGTAVLWRV